MHRTLAGISLFVLAVVAPAWIGGAPLGRHEIGNANPVLVAEDDADGRASPPPAQGGSARQATTWYFYTVKWGFQDEFLDLFQKNHYPVLKARMDAGYYAAIRTYQPRYHGDGRADWTFAVELVANLDAPDEPTEAQVIAKLYPDQATFRKEERRRFELLEAHWDVPLAPVEFATRKPTTAR